MLQILRCTYKQNPETMNNTYQKLEEESWYSAYVFPDGYW